MVSSRVTDGTAHPGAVSADQFLHTSQLATVLAFEHGHQIQGERAEESQGKGSVGDPRQIFGFTVDCFDHVVFMPVRFGPSACFALDTWEKDLIAKFGVRFHRQMCHLQIMHVDCNSEIATQIAIDKHLANHLNRIAVDTTLAHLFPRP